MKYFWIFEFLIAMVMKIHGFWNARSCGPAIQVFTSNDLTGLEI